jgi:hypothetical protein
MTLANKKFIFGTFLFVILIFIFIYLTTCEADFVCVDVLNFVITFKKKPTPNNTKSMHLYSSPTLQVQFTKKSTMAVTEFSTSLTLQNTLTCQSENKGF